jgi:stage II sporulation protein D
MVKILPKILIFVAIAAAVTAVIAGILPRSEATGSAAPKTVTVWLCERGEIVTVSYREYIVGCLFGAVSPKYDEKALNAAAAALNTTALYTLSEKSGFVNYGADFSDETEYLPFIMEEDAEELYGDKYPKYLAKMQSAADSGMKTVITYGGKPIYAAMCELSTGLTDSAADLGMSGFPYLASVEASADKDADGYKSVWALTPESIAPKLREICGGALNVDYANMFKNAVCLDSGTLKSVDICGCTVTGEQLRALLGLRSTAVTIEYAEDRFRFTCRGVGNNLGMSLYSANEAALRGAAAEEIIAYFYPGTEIATIK